MSRFKSRHHLLPAGLVPRVLFHDRENYLFAMQAVDADHTVWKARLLQGQIDLQIAAALGGYLATIHRRTAHDVELRDRFGDTGFFVELRIDPFYRRVAEVHTDLRVAIERLVDETLEKSVCLVHGDFSPKNILITRSGLSLVDYETGHFGDPAFDLGFFLSHLLLKTVLYQDRCAEFLGLARTFWQSYLAGLGRTAESDGFGGSDLDRRTIPHTAACMLARIDGTSPIDYLTQDAAQECVRAFSRRLLVDPPAQVETVLERLQMELPYPHRT